MVPQCPKRKQEKNACILYLFGDYSFRPESRFPRNEKVPLENNMTCFYFHNDGQMQPGKNNLCVCVCARRV